jgi:hypothetical protein
MTFILFYFKYSRSTLLVMVIIYKLCFKVKFLQVNPEGVQYIIACLQYIVEISEVKKH